MEGLDEHTGAAIFGGRSAQNRVTKGVGGVPRSLCRGGWRVSTFRYRNTDVDPTIHF